MFVYGLGVVLLCIVIISYVLRVQVAFVLFCLRSSFKDSLRPGVQVSGYTKNKGLSLVLVSSLFGPGSSVSLLLQLLFCLVLAGLQFPFLVSLGFFCILQLFQQFSRFQRCLVFIQSTFFNSYDIKKLVVLVFRVSVAVFKFPQLVFYSSKVFYFVPSFLLLCF